MNKIKITEEELYNWLDDESTIEIGTERYKHDMNWVTYVTKKDDKWYKYTVVHSYNEGLQVWGDTEAVEVKQVEKIVTTWEEVK